MTWFDFARLMRTIYGRNLPDLALIQRLGLLAVKIGQTYAVRVDFLNERSCRHLARLFRNTDQVPASEIARLIDANAPAGWRDRFASIEQRPLASASVGQVHRARLRGGEEVVVKLIKSDFEASFVKDVRSLRRLLRLAVAAYPKLEKVADPVGILENIERNTLDELDLRREAQGQRDLRAIRDRSAGSFDLSRMQFPRIHDELSGSRILVSEFIAGHTLDELLEHGRLEYRQLLDLFHIHGFFVFCVGTFHGDIHPGNILLSNGNLFFLDTGAISTVGHKMRKGLFAFFVALSGFDYEACAHALNAMAEVEISGAAFERFRRKFLELYADFTNSTVAQVSLTKKMMDTIKLGVHSGMVFEKGMYPVIKSLMYLDGMVLRCKPDAVLLRDMRPFIEEFAGRVA